MTSKPTWLTRPRILAFGLALVAAGLFQPIYQVAEQTFGKEQTAELFRWILAAKEETEAGTNAPPVNPTPVQDSTVKDSLTVDAIDLRRVNQHGKNRVDYSRMQTVDLLRFADIDDRNHVRYNNDLPSSWWRGSSPTQLVRMHVFWPDGGGYYGGHFDWCRQGQTYKTLDNIPKGYLGRVPPRGSPMYFVLISNDGRYRTQVVQSKRNW